MSQRFPPYDGPPDLAPYVRGRWVSGAYEPNLFEQERHYTQRTGPGLDSWITQQGQAHGAPTARDFRGRGPRGWRKSDDRILDEVCRELQRNSEVDASDIEVSCQDGELTLQGWVQERRQKRLAEWIADGVPGVHDVHNRLRVRDPSRPDLAQVAPAGGSQADLSTESTVDGSTRESRTGHFGVTS